MTYVREPWTSPWREQRTPGRHEGMNATEYRRLLERGDGHAWSLADVVRLQRRVARLRPS